MAQALLLHLSICSSAEVFSPEFSAGELLEFQLQDPAYFLVLLPSGFIESVSFDFNGAS